MNNIKLTADQEAAAKKFMTFMANEDRFMVLSGGSGCGKSTLVRYLLSNIRDQVETLNLIMSKKRDINFPIHVTAPTNQAAKVIADMAGTEQQTIQSLLGVRPIPDGKGGMKLVKSKASEDIHNALIIVDEGSFVGKFLLQCIKDMAINCKVLFIGDEYQLAPPKESCLPVFHMGAMQANLTTVVRNQGPIARLGEQYKDVVRNIMQVSKTGNPILDHQNTKAIKWPTIMPNGNEILMLDPEAFQREVDYEFTRTGRHHDDARILAWTNDQVIGYNNYIRDLHGLPPMVVEGEVLRSNKPIFAGNRIDFPTDSVVKVRRVYDLEKLHGVLGYKIGLVGTSSTYFLPNCQTEVKNLLRELADTKQWGDYYNIKEEWMDLRPLHASTVHKAQGSTYQRVFVDLSDIGRCSTPEDVARMMYVGPTRAKQQVIFCGNLPRHYGG